MLNYNNLKKIGELEKVVCNALAVLNMVQEI